MHILSGLKSRMQFHRKVDLRTVLVALEMVLVRFSLDSIKKALKKQIGGSTEFTLIRSSFFLFWFYC